MNATILTKTRHFEDIHTFGIPDAFSLKSSLGRFLFLSLRTLNLCTYVGLFLCLDGTVSLELQRLGEARPGEVSRDAITGRPPMCPFPTCPSYARRYACKYNIVDCYCGHLWQVYVILFFSIPLNVLPQLIAHFKAVVIWFVMLPWMFQCSHTYGL